MMGVLAGGRCGRDGEDTVLSSLHGVRRPTTGSTGEEEI